MLTAAMLLIFILIFIFIFILIFIFIMHCRKCHGMRSHNYEEI